MDNDKERESIIKELSTNYDYSNKDISKILQEKGFKMDIRILTSQMRYFRWDAIIESIDNDGLYRPSEKTIILIDNYLNTYPDCWRTLAIKCSFS